MNIIIHSSLKTLAKSKTLLNNLNVENYCDCTVSPYYSSIGSHMRHILDFYDCIFSLNSEGKVDLTARNRDKVIETDCNAARIYLNVVLKKIEHFDKDINSLIPVIDDLGLGKTEILYTYGALLSQANSHTIHHYAIINYILDGLNISMKDSDFGYNPTTPKVILKN